MNCMQHVSLPAVATCQKCGVGLCQQCASKYTPPICDSCVAANYRKRKSGYVVSFIASVVIALLTMGICVYAMLTTQPDSVALQPEYRLRLIGVITFYGVLFGCFPQGWAGLTSITPKMFLTMPCLFWYFFLVIKAGLALFVGPIFLVVRIVQFVLLSRKPQI